MKNQYFTLTIVQTESGTDVRGQYQTTAAFLTKFLGKVLKLHPELIPIFLDATGAALIGDIPPQQERQNQLAEFWPASNDERFYDEIFG